MGYRDDEIAFEFAEQLGGRREFFDGTGYSFRRLGKIDNSDIDRLAAAMACKRRYAANPEKYRAMCRDWYRRAKADPKKWERRLAQWRAKEAKTKAKNPKAFNARKLADCRRHRARVYADPARHEAWKAKQRERSRAYYRRTKADPVKAAERKRKDHERYLRTRERRIQQSRERYQRLKANAKDAPAP